MVWWESQDTNLGDRTALLDRPLTPLLLGFRSLEVSGQCLADLSHFLVIKS